MTRLFRCTALLLLVLLAVPAAADEAKKLFNQGRDAEARQDYEAAYDLYSQAWNLKPKDLKYRTSAQRTRFLAASSYVNRGQKLREAGNLDEALLLFQKAIVIDPSNALAQQEARRTKEAIEARDKTGAPPPPAPTALQRRVAEAEGPVELAPISDTPITLKLTEDTRVIYETIGKLAGINVLFDPDYTSRRIKIELNGVTLNQALDILALESKTFWRPVTTNTIFVAADTPAKRKELEQSVVKTFYLANLSQPTELQDVVNALRQILEISRVQQLPSQSAIVIRGTPDQVALAEKLIGDIDKAKPEVVVEVAIMQVRRDRLRQLGVSPPTSGSIALQGVTTSTTGTGTGTGTSTTTPNTINLNNLANLSAKDFVVTIPQASASFLFTDSSTRVIQNPQIRALDGQKASLKIGDRVPVATGSFQPGIGGVGINPLVNTQFQYIDVGVNIDITPKIHQTREVSLKLMIDVSSVTSRVNIGGIEQPVIGQRKIEHEIRLREGEVNLLGGILEEQDVNSWSGIPGLGQIPLLRYLFAQQRKERAENEIVFVLIPHIVRAQDLTELNQRALDVGTGSAIDLRRASRTQPVPPPPAAGAPAQTSPPPEPVQQVPVQPAPAPQAPAQQAAPPAPLQPVRLSFDPPDITQSVGSTFTVNVVLSGGQDVYSVPIQLSYDPRLLQLVNISNGGFLSQDGQPVALVHRDDASSGLIQVTATRPPKTPGITGDGPIFTLTFAAKAAGTAPINITRPGARNASMQPIQATATTGTVTIK